MGFRSARSVGKDSGDDGAIKLNIFTGPCGALKPPDMHVARLLQHVAICLLDFLSSARRGQAI